MTTVKTTRGSVPIPSTGTGSAGNPVTLPSGPSSTVLPGATTGGAPVVAPKGFRLTLSQMLAGWELVIPAGAAMTSRGGSLDQATVQAQLEAFMEDYTSLDAAALALTAARTQEKLDLPAAKALIAQLKEALVAFYGATSPQLARFGMKPKGAPRTQSIAKKAVAVAKNKNTRVIRGTMGKVEKADLKSGPMTVTVAPTATPVAPAPVATGGGAAVIPATDVPPPAAAGK